MPATEHSKQPQPDLANPADVQALIQSKLTPVEATLDELRALFTGVPAEDGNWATTPAYTVGLAFEICKRTDCRAEHQLRELLYDTTSPDDVPGAALDVIKLAAQRYRSWRDYDARRALGRSS